MDEMSDIIDGLSFFMENDPLSVEDASCEINKILRGNVVASASYAVSTATMAAEEELPFGHATTLTVRTRGAVGDDSVAFRVDGDFDMETPQDRNNASTSHDYDNGCADGAGMSISCAPDQNFALDSSTDDNVIMSDGRKGIFSCEKAMRRCCRFRL